MRMCDPGGTPSTVSFDPLPKWRGSNYSFRFCLTIADITATVPPRPRPPPRTVPNITGGLHKACPIDQLKQASFSDFHGERAGCVGNTVAPAKAAGDFIETCVETLPVKIIPFSA